MDVSLKPKNGLKRRKFQEQNGTSGHVTATPARRRSSWPRIFKPQPSLTDQLTVTDKSFQIIRDIAMVHTVLVIVYILLRDLYIKGKSVLELSWLTSGLGSPDALLKALGVELGLLTLALLVQPTLQLWRVVRASLKGLQRVVDLLFALSFVIYVTGTAAFVCWISYRLPFATYTTGILTIEQFLSPKLYESWYGFQ